MKKTRKIKKVSEDSKISEKQLLAVLELLKPNNKSFEEVSKRLGISSRTLYNWRHDPEFSLALDNALLELKERLLSSSEFSVLIRAVDNMLSYETKVIDSIDIRNTIIRLVENQDRLKAELKMVQRNLLNLERKIDKQ